MRKIHISDVVLDEKYLHRLNNLGILSYLLRMD